MVGTLDGLYAFISSAVRGRDPLNPFRAITGGIIGPDAFDGSTATALAGILLHFTVATTVVLVFYLASRRIPFIRRHPIPSGLLYGLLVYFVMYGLVIPLSALPVSFSDFRPELAPVVVHLFLVGLPAALVVTGRGSRVA